MYSLEQSQHRGYAMTLMVIIFASIFLLVVSHASLSSLTSLKNSQISIREVKIKEFTEGCSEEALLQLSRNNQYKGATYNLQGGTCDISVSGTSSSRIISVTGTLSNLSHNYKLEVNMNPFEITKWQY